jgi:hypothetical protein
MSGRFLPADHSRGDEGTIGGYMAVHDRPAAFEGSDGLSYSVAIEAAETGEPEPSRRWGGFLLFLRWRRVGEQGVEGHLETDFLAWGDTAEAAIAATGALPLADVQMLLERRLQRGMRGRPWRDARDDAGAEGV